jgi:hypothetical protein
MVWSSIKHPISEMGKEFFIFNKILTFNVRILKKEIVYLSIND